MRKFHPQWIGERRGSAVDRIGEGEKRWALRTGCAQCYAVTRPQVVPGDNGGMWVG